MRTISTEQEDILNSVKYDVHLRLEVEDSTGGMTNLSNLGGADWVEGVKWDWSIDQPVAQLTATIRRDHGPSTGESLAPLDADSTYNFNSTDGFARRIDVGRDIDVYTAVTSAGAAAPGTSEYEWVFQGEIDEVRWERSPMQIVGRSKNFAALADRWIESTDNTYGTSTGDDIDTVIEELLADHTDLSTSILLADTSHSFLVSPAYSPEKQQLLQAVTAVTQLIGWQLRDLWSTASTSWRIRFDEPNRTATSSETDWTFGPEHYFDVRRMNLNRADVRNVISVIYGDSSRAREQIVAEATSSQDQYGRQWMEFEEGTNSAIDSSAAADTLAQAVLADLKEPPISHEIEVPYFYPAEVGDYYQFNPNDVHYSEHQYLGVYGVTHDLGRDRHRTSVRVRGQPAGYSLRWFDYPGGGGGPIDAAITHVDVTQRSYSATTSEHALMSHTVRPMIYERAFGLLFRWSVTGTAGGKSVEVRYGGTPVAGPTTYAAGDQAAGEFSFEIAALGSTVGRSSWPIPTAGAPIYYAITSVDLADEQDFEFLVELDSTSDTATLQYSEVRELGRTS